MFLPHSGRRRRVAENDGWEDTWDQYQEKRVARAPPSASIRLRSGSAWEAEAQGSTAATQDAIARAFASSNAMAALGDGEPTTDSGHRLVRDQARHRSYDAYDANVLPRSATCTLSTPENYYLAGPRVDDREKDGTFTDRLGNTYDVLKTRLPPGDKDYRSTAAHTSHRHLERCHGSDPYFHARPKKEVEHETNPAEPRGDGQGQRHRQAVSSLKAQQLFFNQSGMQKAAEMDTGREQYDGHNVKANYRDLVHSVEPCWRATLVRDQTVRAEPADAARGAPHAGVELRRTEASGVFRRKPLSASPALPVSAARIALPFLPEATLRASPCFDTHSQQFTSFALGSRMGEGGVDALVREEVAAPETHRADAEVGARAADPSVAVGSADATSIDASCNGAGPHVFSASLADTTGRGDTQRESDMVQPTASRDWNLVQKMIASEEREAEDDTEVSELTRRTTDVRLHVPVLPQAQGHQLRDDVVERPNDISDHAVSAARVAAQTTREGEDAHAGAEPRGDWAVANAAATHAVAEVTREGRDEMAAHELGAKTMDGVGARIVRARVEVHREDAKLRDDARTSLERPVGALVRSAPQLGAERTHAAASGAADSQGLATRARPALPARAPRAILEHSYTGLPLSEVATMAPASKATARLPNRAETSSSVPSHAAFEGGGRLEAARQMVRTEAELGRLNGGDAVHGVGAGHAASRGDRGPEARSSYGNLPLRSAEGFKVATAARDMIVAPSKGRAGLSSTCRLESASVQSGNHEMSRPHSSMRQRHQERVTPTRSLSTPTHMDVQGGRWTPSLQQNETLRNVDNRRLFVK